MPEGPEIRRAADRLAAAVVGEPLRSAWFAFPTLKPFESKLIGHRIEAIVPHGKALLTRFDHGWTLYSHNQLYGVWKIAESGERPDTTRSTPNAARSCCIRPPRSKCGAATRSNAIRS
jgi:endonuclease-8